MKIRILIVEDDESMLELILAHLAAEPDFDVVGTTPNGGQALVLVQQHRPHIVLMDLSLPGLNGLQATKLIRKECPRTAVVILSNYELGDLRDRVRENPEILQTAAFVSKREISTRLCAVIRSVRKEELRRSL